jgi:hypothetical protein
MPAVCLPQIKGLRLPKMGAGFDFATIELPSFRLKEFPGIDFSAFDALDGCVDFPSLRIPSITLDAFPHLSLPEIPGIDWGEVRLPEMRLGSFPGVQLPEFPSVKMPTISGARGRIINWELPEIGGLLMKFKLVLGFVQCVSFIPDTFSLIPWPLAMIELAHFLHMISVDALSMLGNLCNLHTGFYPRFLFQVFVLPTIYLSTWITYLIARRLSARRCPARAALFTAESVRTRLFEILFLVTYTLYTSVSTTILRIFKCRHVQGRWYLTDDFHVICFEGEWWFFAALAVCGIGTSF